MSFYHHPDIMQELVKDRIREFHQECQMLNLANEVKNHPPGLVRTAWNRFASFFKLMALNLEKRFGVGRAVRKQAVALRAHTSLRSTHFGL